MYTVGESHTVSYNGMIQKTCKYCQEVLQAGHPYGTGIQIT